ncbi:hypothetical protein GCM10023189_29740 [Nibrella saemangeumensis]|uniref:Outer membrane protein beta-barrel domain-containing protein n=1 Tax=Nibrella saemangeumensis TaxID=1084526 RepID=A0ABP8MY43_9BACT
MKQSFFALFFLLSIQLHAQSPVSSRIAAGADAQVAFGKGTIAPSISYYQLLNVGPNNMFSFGWTTRLGTFYGNNLNYITAPARLTRGKTGLEALSAPLLVANIDTMQFKRVSLTSLNFGVRAQVTVGIVQIGASADIFGVAFSRNRRGLYRSTNGQFIQETTLGNDTIPLQGASVAAVAPRFNARLLGDNNSGTLATEIFVRVKINQRLSAKAGYQWMMTEMRAFTVNVTDNNDRFRNRMGMPYIGLTFPFFH